MGNHYNKTVSVARGAVHYPYELDKKGVSINWEDLLQDEKIEKLMQVTTRLYVDNERLRRTVNQLLRHKHNNRGEAVTENEIGAPQEAYERINDNPFNSKEISESEDRYY